MNPPHKVLGEILILILELLGEEKILFELISRYRHMELFFKINKKSD